jgi:sterol desaturase/sphingolipid hydroxylase (fatty acid hydroxylase superfamily)
LDAANIVGALIPITFVVFLVTERMFPRRRYPPIRSWNLIRFACFVMTGVLSALLPMLLPASWTQHHLFNGARPGLVGSVLVAYPLSALGSALLHRAFHEFHPLWLLGHQLHHSPRRIPRCRPAAPAGGVGVGGQQK